MKILWLHRIAAYGFQITCLGTALLFGIYVGVLGFPGAGYLTDLSNLAPYAAAIILNGLLGCMIGAVVIWRLVGWLFYWIQGYPFQNGDKVYILVGQHAGTTSRIYEIWPQRSQVRVDLGEKMKANVEDVFCYTSLFKIKEP